MLLMHDLNQEIQGILWRGYSVIQWSRAERPIHSERQGRVVPQNCHEDLWNDHLGRASDVTNSSPSQNPTSISHRGFPKMGRPQNPANHSFFCGIVHYHPAIGLPPPFMEPLRSSLSRHYTHIYILCGGFLKWGYFLIIQVIDDHFSMA